MEMANSIIMRFQTLFNASARNGYTPDAKIPIVSTAEDNKRLDKIDKMVTSIHYLCTRPGMNLPQSAPFVVQLLPEIRDYLFRILDRTSYILEENEYLQLFVTNLISKCKETKKMILDANKDAYDPNSIVRKRLTKKALIFSHMLNELKAEFPDYCFIGEEFRFTKTQAGEYWKQKFGNRTTVSWAEFRDEISMLSPTVILKNTTDLKNSIDLTRNDSVSNYEFDVFVRLFYPWDRLFETWEAVAIKHPGYMAFLTYEEVKERLKGNSAKVGSYVFRMSCTKMGEWAIGYVGNDGKVYQTIPRNKSIVQALHDGSRDRYYLYPDGNQKNIDLSKFLPKASCSQIQVDSEQHRLYSEIGSTFELCKICDERDKNVRLEPCQHLMCMKCLKNWLNSADENSQKCPFCREYIRGTEPIRVVAYSSAVSDFPPSEPAPPPPSEMDEINAQIKRSCETRERVHPQ